MERIPTVNNRKFEIIGIFLLYFLFAFGYHLTLWINGRHYLEGFSFLLSPVEFMDSAGLDYLVKGLLSIPIWWVIFKLLKERPIWQRLLVHLIGLPIFLFTFIRLYYFLCEKIGFWHLTAEGSVWDVYIPCLFYIIQFGIFHAYEYYRRNERNLHLKAELQQAALKSELKALKAQLNPHFLYNTFNAISASVPPEQENTREMIAGLSDLFRYQLKGSKTDLVPLKEEIEFIEKYLSLEKIRFGERLKFEIVADQASMNRMVPPMILQPLLENAIQHGISPLIEGGKIELLIKANLNYTQFMIKDNGKGFNASKNTEGIGLANTKLRLSKMYNQELIIQSTEGNGTSIEFKIPIAA